MVESFDLALPETIPNHRQLSSFQSATFRPGLCLDRYPNPMRQFCSYITVLIVLLFAAQPLLFSQGSLRDRIAARRAQTKPESLDDNDSGGTISLPASVHVVRDVSYGADPLQRFDVYLPAHASNAPVILMVHGGGWRFGDKTNSRVVQNKINDWVPRGFVFISVNYRMLPGTGPFEQAKDVACALAAAQSRAREWNADPAKFIVMGHSAGAHLVALLAASPNLAASARVKPWLGTISLDSAALDVSAVMEQRHLPLYDAAFGNDRAYWRSTSPLDQLARGAAPILAVCSSRRQDSCPDAHAFIKKATSLGIRAQVLEEDLSHAEINMTLGVSGAYTSAVEEFMRSLDPAIKTALSF